MGEFIVIENKDHASWLKARTYGIGGSDASAIVGMNPYKTNIDLFEEKTGCRIPEDISEKPYAEKYSQAFKRNGGAKSLELLEQGKIQEKDLWKYSSFWFKDFDAMAHKTMIRQLISKWGTMSVDFQKAIDKDMTVLHEDGSVDYVENQVEAEENVAVEQEYKEVLVESEQVEESSRGNQQSLEDAFFAQ